MMVALNGGGQVDMVDAGIMRNLASPDKLLEWARLEGVREGAIQVVPVWQIPCVLVVNTDGSVDGTAMNTVVSRRWCASVSCICVDRVLRRVWYPTAS